LSRQCGILNISQPYRPPRPVTGIALLYISQKEIEGKERPGLDSENDVRDLRVKKLRQKRNNKEESSSLKGDDILVGQQRQS
jgi:hypothetical protein